MNHLPIKGNSKKEILIVDKMKNYISLLINLISSKIILN